MKKVILISLLVLTLIPTTAFAKKKSHRECLYLRTNSIGLEEGNPVNRIKFHTNGRVYYAWLHCSDHEAQGYGAYGERICRGDIFYSLGIDPKTNTISLSQSTWCRVLRITPNPKR